MPTPYGFKRERWLDGALARAYGLPADAFVPWASPRTTLERVTDAAASLLVRAEVRAAAVGDSAASLGLARHTSSGPFALAYALGGRLVTTFPVGSADEILAEWDADPSRPRWNAVERGALTLPSHQVLARGTVTTSEISGSSEGYPRIGPKKPGSLTLRMPGP